MSNRAPPTPLLQNRKPGIPRRTSSGGDGDDAMALTAPPAALLLVLFALAATLALPPRQASAQISAPPLAAPAPSSSLDCAGALLNLTPCLTYVERRSALTRPDKGCCGALAAVVGGDHAACLCALLAGYGYGGVRVDAVRALALPTICRVDAPPPRLCAALGMPVAEPPGGAASAPMDSGSDAPSATPATAATNGVPATRPRASTRPYQVAALWGGRLIILSTMLLL